MPGVKEIWDFVQSDPQYKNKTTLFITTDHGRGNTTKQNGQVMALL
jgi:hypothetical protein